VLHGFFDRGQFGDGIRGGNVDALQDFLATATRSIAGSVL
jgi:hypothetical protein